MGCAVIDESGRDPSGRTGPLADHAPPALSTWLLALLVPRPRREQFVGDLVEEFRSRQEGASAAIARRWFRWQVLRSVGPIAWQRVNISPVMQTVVGVMMAFAGLWVWIWVLNVPPIRDRVFGLVGSPLAFLVTVLELSTYVVAGLVVGRLATFRPFVAVMATSLLIWLWPAAVRSLATGSLALPGPVWSAVLVFGGVQLGAWATARRRVRAT